MEEKTKKKIKKEAKKVGKKIVKAAKKEPKKAAIIIICIILVIGITLACLYFSGALNSFLPNSSEPNTSEPTTSEPSEQPSEQPSTTVRQIKSVMETYVKDTDNSLDPDNGGLSDSEVATITNDIVSYYATVDGTYVGQTLWNTLHTVTAPKQLTSYGELRYSEKGNPYADMCPTDETKFVDFYSGIMFPSVWGSGQTWNREHVWCTSHSWWGKAPSNSTRHGGTDLHHLRPEIASINSSRNNSLFGEVSNRETKEKYYTYEGTKYLYGYLDGEIDPRVETNSVEGVFEPTDRVKGDVARIVMYLLVRYKDVATPVTNIIYTPEGTADACYQLLLKWHEEDPVSNHEIKRNHRTYLVQGNRNPFIDCPNYANNIWNNLD